MEATLGHVSVYFDPPSGSLWLGSDLAASLPGNSEILGFGAGELQEGPNATDLILRADGSYTNSRP